jgi:hypothetical protein
MGNLVEGLGKVLPVATAVDDFLTTSPDFTGLAKPGRTSAEAGVDAARLLVSIVRLLGAGSGPADCLVSRDAVVEGVGRDKRFVVAAASTPNVRV